VEHAVKIRCIGEMRRREGTEDREGRRKEIEREGHDNIRGRQER
jgi:hypothetical protein